MTPGVDVVAMWALGIVIAFAQVLFFFVLRGLKSSIARAHQRIDEAVQELNNHRVEAAATYISEGKIDRKLEQSLASLHESLGRIEVLCKRD